ncbi:MAG TPA: D-alanyl-D-alanine carboxypeptidase family protein [Candidatus Binatia bacterium]|nr:D-alanyl-D-alanine carboxypeptidase family protein [Candidatus Binatia bacterium]
MMGGRGSGIALAIAVGLGGALLMAAPVAAAAPSVSARGAIVMDAATGEVLWERNASSPLPPASTTKVMTAIVALESGRLDESFRVSADAADTAPSKINLRPGQRMRLKNLLYAVLLNSANDAASVVAEGLAGSEQAFAARMNARAEALGATTAHFANPHGLTAPGHVASARDLAVIFRYGLRVPLFRELLETRSVQVPVESTGVQWVSLRSHNRLLSGYTYLVIGKTGFTRPAGRCFVGSATHDGRELVIALLGSRDLWGDAKRLFNYGFGGAPERPRVVMAGMAPVVSPTRVKNAEGDDDPTAGTARYAVRLGPFRTRAAAAATRVRLARRGYRAVVAGRTLQIGSYANVGLAERTAGRLRRTGYTSPVVVLL